MKIPDGCECVEASIVRVRDGEDPLDAFDRHMAASARQVLLLGEDNPLSAEPEFALYPRPDGCSGHRLMQILGLDEDRYLALHRANLCDQGAWSMREAKQRARRYLTNQTAPWRVVVLLGRKVADAFGYERPFFTSGIEEATATWTTPITLISLPHPSGRNTMWNNLALHDRARELIREVAPGVYA